MSLRARLLARMPTIQTFLARVANMLSPLGTRIDTLAVGAIRVTALATACHQSVAPSQTPVVVRVLRTRHGGLVFTVGELFHDYFIAPNIVQHVQLEARVVP